jgi:hypothetical protein
VVKLGELMPELQHIADEMSADTAPADLAGLSPAQLRAELLARGIEQPDRAQEKQRRKSKRRLAKYYRGRRRK